MTETSPRIARLLRDLPGGSAQALADFWREAAATGTPLVEQVDGGNALVTFVWRGQAAETIAGWGVDVTLRRVPGTDLWHGSQRLPVDLRTLYFLAHGREDVLTIPTQPTGTGPTHLDPLNRRPFRFPADRTDPNDRPCWASLLELPAAPSEQWSQPGPGVDRGTFLPTSIRTAALGGRRRVGVYRPAGAGDEPLPVVVIFDGYLSRRVLRIPTTLDNLIAAGLIPPTMALFVNAPSGAVGSASCARARPSGRSSSGN